MFRGRAARFASRTAEPAVSSRVLLLPGADAQSLSCAGGGSGHGHRTSLPASGTSGRLKIRPCGRPWRRAYGSGSLTPMPTFRTVVPSHLWLGTGPPGLHSSIPPHSRGVKIRAWDCKLTPADCACQERNTTGCIPSNDGLDAGLGTGFPQKSFASCQPPVASSQLTRVSSSFLRSD